MAATTVTGRGLGMSNGLYKPENQCGGCGCGSNTTETTPTPRTKLGCFTRNKSGNTLSYKRSGLGGSIRVCS